MEKETEASVSHLSVRERTSSSDPQMRAVCPPQDSARFTRGSGAPSADSDFHALSYPHSDLKKTRSPAEGDLTCRVYLFLKQLVTSSPLDSWYNHVSFLPLWRLA